MNYLKDYNILKKIYNETDGEIKIPGSEIVIYNNKFESNGNDIYPDRNEYEKKYNYSQYILYVRAIIFYDSMSARPETAPKYNITGCCDNKRQCYDSSEPIPNE